MVDTKRFKNLIDRKGYKIQWVAEQVGLTGGGFSAKLHNRNQFKAEEIQILCRILEIDLKEKEKIFFAEKVDL